MNIDVLGVPIDFGAGRRGVDMGPSAIRLAGLDDRLSELGHTVHDLGNVEVTQYEEQPAGDSQMRFLEPIVRVGQQLADRLAHCVSEGRLPLVLGGDHSMSLGAVRGVSRVKKVGVIWIDAHGDFNTHETSPSGNIHGMPLAALVGFGHPNLVNLGQTEPPTRLIDPHNVAIVGVRSLDPGERGLLRTAGVHVFPMEQIDRSGMYEVIRQALRVATAGTDGIYVSLDLDALDPLYAPGVGTPEPGGLTYREAHLACEVLAESKKLAGFDMVEVNPILDHRNKTAEMAVSLAQSLLGKCVW